MLLFSDGHRRFYYVAGLETNVSNLLRRVCKHWVSKKMNLKKINDTLNP